VLGDLKPGQELTRVFDEQLLARYYDIARQGSRYNLSNGDPLQNPFDPIRKAVSTAMRGSEMTLYTRGGGPRKFRDRVLPYCENLGISPSKKTLSSEHVTFGMGSTYLYNATLKILAQRGGKINPGKKPVLLMPAPTYGIFTMQPVNNGYVAALYHANPHNPTGAVADATQTQKIMRVLKRNKVFAIDDMAYAGIEHRSKAAPLAMHGFDNSVTLFSLSKAYAMPRVRSGVACGPDWLIEGIDHETDMSMISIPAPSFAAASACFSEEHQHVREKEYLPQNNVEYQRRFDVLKAVIDGIDSVPDLPGSRAMDILHEAEKAYGSLPQAKEALKTGMPNLRILNDSPDAGYFAILQIDGLEEMFYGTTPITNSFQFSLAAIDIGKVLPLPLKLALAGDDFKDGIRISFGGMQDKTLIKALKGLNHTIASLSRAPDRDQEARLKSTGKALGRSFTY